MYRPQSQKLPFSFKSLFKSAFQGVWLFRLCIAALLCIVLLIFFINYPANLPPWRFFGTTLALVLLLVLNLFFSDPKAASEKQRALHDWLYLGSSALLIMAAVGLSNQLDLVYMLSIVAVQAGFKRGPWPSGMAFGSILLVAWLGYQIAIQSNFNQILARETALAVGIIFGLLGTSLVSRYARQTKRAEDLLAQLQATQLELETAHQNEKDLAVAEERIRLARDLHDSVTQSLYSVTLYAQAAADLLSAGEIDTAAQHLRDLSETAQQAMREMRLLIFELRRPALDQDGLVAALQARLDAVERRGGLQTELQVQGCPQLPQAVQAELYAIAQEALNNVLKHSHAKNIRVILHCQDGLIELQICDDGVGFEPTAIQPSGGFGIAGMRERARKIAATLQIDSAPGQGARLIVRLPASEASGTSPTPPDQNELAPAQLEKD